MNLRLSQTVNPLDTFLNKFCSSKARNIYWAILKLSMRLLMWKFPKEANRHKQNSKKKSKSWQKLKFLKCNCALDHLKNSRILVIYDEKNVKKFNQIISLSNFQNVLNVKFLHGKRVMDKKCYPPQLTYAMLAATFLC